MKRYSEPILRQWRRHAEELAREALGRPQHATHERHIVPHKRALPLDRASLATAIAEFLDDIGLPLAWGGYPNDLVRMALYELALNALQHGAASSIELESHRSALCLRDQDAPRFGLEMLEGEGRGGREAVRAIRRELNGEVDVVHKWMTSKNEWWLIDLANQETKANPCALFVEGHGREGAIASLTKQEARLQGCEVIHVYIPRLWSFSDVYPLYEAVHSRFPGRVLICHGVDPEHALAKHILHFIPSARFVRQHISIDM